MKQTILVTGASSGIGLYIANRLHESGYNVIGTSRSPEKYQSKIQFKLLALDITDSNSIQSFTKELFSQIDTLDVVINNAGFMVTGLVEETSIELGKQQFETNFWGTVSLTNELLPYLRKQRHGKIITTGSFFGLVGHPSVAYYSASKHALEGYFKSLRFELNQFNIKVSMIEPMYTKSNIESHGVVGDERIADYDTLRRNISSMYSREFAKAPEPTNVIKAVMKIINEANPKFSYPVGKGTSLILILQRFAYKTFESVVLKLINSIKK
ncbi:SDR family NAD(P)-dependent oxidoreductase [Segatella paludivivens]|uniref:SDR family NAD(P)-dependent oxidoreductase n=1 Tax=Segatella paludivivens TaxID=185294 RepID=UPI00037C65C8|nr:SDR family NAD(P)-dependent oxidoreductase [Segatella paludivivens]